MNEINADQLLQQMRLMSQRAQAFTAESAPNQSADFSRMLKNSIDSVSSVQKKAATLAAEYEKGNPAVSLPDVMIQLQKANVSFQAMTQVRNRLVSAYQDIMNMQI